jgi:sodium-dependent dicarboxylate transporter 2/3/5
MAFQRLALFGVSLAIGWVTYQVSWTLEESMRITLAIFMIAVILWITEWIPLFLTSFVILLLQVIFLGRKEIWGEKSYTAFFEPFFSPIITLFLGGFALSFAMHKYRLDLMLAAWMLKKSKGSPRRLISFLLLFSAVLSMWISNTAATVLLMMVVLPVIKNHVGKPFCKSALLAIPIGATIGGVATPIGTPPNAVGMSALYNEGILLSIPEWFVLTAPICILVLLISRIGLEVLFPIGRMEFVDLHTERVNWSGASAGVVAIFLITVFLWLMTPLHGIPDGIIALVPLILLFMTRLLHPKDIKEMGWDTLLLVGGGMSLGVSMKESGLAEMVVNQVASSSISTAAIVVAIGVLTLLLSTFISNTVATSLTIPLVIAMEGELITGVLLIAIASSMALALPVSSPANAIIFSNGYIRSWDMFKMGGLVSIIGMLVLYLASVIYWPWILNLRLLQ